MLSMFSNFHSFEYLHAHGYSEIPNKKGVYIVSVPENFTKTITPDTVAINEYRDRSMLYHVSILESKWIDNCPILYIGKASGEFNGLRQRIGQYVRYGYAECNNHRGGRAIWQLQDSRSLLIGYMVSDHAENFENELLHEFINRYGKLPYANFRL